MNTLRPFAQWRKDTCHDATGFWKSSDSDVSAGRTSAVEVAIRRRHPMIDRLGLPADLSARLASDRQGS